MFEGRPARMLAGTPVAGADRETTRYVRVGDAEHQPRQQWSGRRVDGVGIDGSQDVEAASGEFAGHRDGGQLAVEMVLDVGVVVVVGAALMRRVLRRFVERPAQRLSPL